MKIKDQAESYSGYRIEDTVRIWSRLDKELREKEGSRWLWVLAGGLAVPMLGWDVEWMSSDLDLVSQRWWQVRGGGCDHQLATMQQSSGCVRYFSDSLTSPSQ